MSPHNTSTHARAGSQRPPSAERPMRRIFCMHGLFLVALLAIVLRLGTLQILEHSAYATKSLAQVRQEIPITPLRGGIYDRYGHVLAVSEPTSLVIADDFQIKDPAGEAKSLSGLVQVPVGKLTALLSEHNGYVILNPNLNVQNGNTISKAYFPGIVVENSESRSYPNGTLAQSVLGRTNSTNVGTTGLEYGYQSLLAGQQGLERAYVAQSGVSLPNTYTEIVKKSTPGVGLELTLDNALQFVAERDLATELHNVNGISAQAVVMDVKTGEILADVSLVNTATNPGALGPIPSWGQSVGVPGIDQTLNNLPFTQAYEPGSMFKIVTFSAALQAGVVTPQTVFAIPGSVRVGGREFHDAENHGLEHLSATQVLAQSSNIGTYEIGLRAGENRILAQVERLGFGQLTNVNFPGETAGLLVNAANWYTSDEVSLPIGQVDAVPAIQVLDSYNAIANNGVFVEPKLLRGYVEPNGSVVATAPSVERRALSVAVAQEMNHMLQQVVLVGTGTNAIIPGYQVAGKTGTASIPDPHADRLLTGEYNASFVGFAPANNPIFSMLVVVERPQTTIFGGSVAAPVFQQVMSYALHHFNIPSDGSHQKPLPGSPGYGSEIT